MGRCSLKLKHNELSLWKKENSTRSRVSVIYPRQLQTQLGSVFLEQQMGSYKALLKNFIQTMNDSCIQNEEILLSAFLDQIVEKAFVVYSNFLYSHYAVELFLNCTVWKRKHAFSWQSIPKRVWFVLQCAIIDEPTPLISS